MVSGDVHLGCSESVRNRQRSRKLKTYIIWSASYFQVSTSAGVLVINMGDGTARLGKAGTAVVIEPAGSFPSGGMVVAINGMVVAVATATKVYSCTCNLGNLGIAARAATSPTCTFSGSDSADDGKSAPAGLGLGSVLSVAASAAKEEEGAGGVRDVVITIWIGSTSGLYKAVLTPAHAATVVTAVVNTPAGINAVVWSPATAAAASFIAAGNSEKLWLINPADGSIKRWEWVTDVATASGGVLDDTVTALVSAPAALREGGEEEEGLPLFVGNPTCLNVRDANASFARIGPDQGLPVGNITSLAVAYDVDGSPQLWVGSAFGVAVWQPMHDPAWRYLFGPRWLVGHAVKQLVTVPHTPDAAGPTPLPPRSSPHRAAAAIAAAAAAGDTVVVLTGKCLNPTRTRNMPSPLSIPNSGW